MKITINLNFFELLTIFLVFGKLSDNLTWNWGAVFAPLLANASYYIMIYIYAWVQITRRKITSASSSITKSKIK